MHPIRLPRTTTTTTPNLITLRLDILRIPHQAVLLDLTEPQPPAAILTRIPHVGDTPALQMPLLDGPDDIHRQLAVPLQRRLPMRRDPVRERQLPRDAADHHLPHRAVLLRVRVHVLHPPQTRVGFIVVIERPARLHHVVAQARDFQFLAQKVKVQQRADVALFFRVAQRFGVQPADEELKRLVFGVGETKCFGGRRFRIWRVELGGEKGGVVAQELFVQDPVGGVFADIDIHEAIGEESIVKVETVFCQSMIE